MTCENIPLRGRFSGHGRPVTPASAITRQSAVNEPIPAISARLPAFTSPAGMVDRPAAMVDRQIPT